MLCKLFGVLYFCYKILVFNILFCGIFGCVGFVLMIVIVMFLVNFGVFFVFSVVNFCVLWFFFDICFGDGVGLLCGVFCLFVGLVMVGWMLVSLDKDVLIMGCSWLGLGVVYFVCWISFFCNLVFDVLV